MAEQDSDVKAKAESSILKHLNFENEISNSRDFSATIGIDHKTVEDVIKSLHGSEFVIYEVHSEERWKLTKEGEQYAADGSPEFQLFSAVPPQGISKEDLKKKTGAAIFELGSKNAAKNKWINMGNFITRKVESVEDQAKQILLLIKGKVIDEETMKNIKVMKTRNLIELERWNVYSLKKGPKFKVEREKPLGDFTREQLQSGEWKKMELKEYNFNAYPLLPDIGHLHPLLKVREQFSKIFIEMGFEEMPTNNYVESSFWNFDALFQPQQHPARDSHDTFFLEAPSTTKSVPEDYLGKVKTVHEVGGYGSTGYKYAWSREEANKNVLRTHTTAVSARMLYSLAQRSFSPRKYFSIDRVFRNEAVDRTHLAEFHQIEGLICDRGLTLGDLMGVLDAFFARLGISNLTYKATYNPYTSPSMEIYSYHEGLKKLVEIGNSGMFRPEMLRPMGFPEDVNVIAWGLSLERPTMILYGIDNIRDLFGHKVDLGLIKKNPICRLGTDN
ncbi:hypothetical protein GIB67_042764 [Kingdonia uniflora]|uniref:phenylalanine--tRNA ligase n=1 Tax=Kingdonia uniflora TaxID=39325 RepID=A0A7J7L119_9MAGN|nr:hypothetical protein GIB67_042764 [Kingdonia uniflora]